tara:strand:+ start:651 stop:950 length:300 start_codon:yes stop_codon:yes gene_type:complete
MSEKEKTYPSHKISFSQKQYDERGRERLGAPVEVATVWPRKGDKQGGIIQWNISPEKLGNDGVYFMLDNERRQSRESSDRDAFDQAQTRANDRDIGNSR